MSARRGGEVCRSVGRSSVLDLRLGRHKWFIPPNCATYGGRKGRLLWPFTVARFIIPEGSLEKVMKKTVFRHGTLNKPGSWAFHRPLLSHCGCQPPGPKSIRAKFASPAGLTCAAADAAAIRRRKETSCAAGPPFGPGGYVPIWKCLFNLCLGTNYLSLVSTESSRHFQVTSTKKVYSYWPPTIGLETIPALNANINKNLKLIFLV